MSDRIPVLVITGPVGVGKTATAEAISDQLSEAGVAHAMVDLDQLRWCHPAPPHDRFHVALGLKNLAAVWASYRAAGARRLVIADVVESPAEVAGYRAAIPGADVRVVRLRAALPTIERRLEGRNQSASLAWHRHRAAELSELMERARVGDLLVDTDGKTTIAVAREILARVGWGSPGGDLAP